MALITLAYLGFIAGHEFVADAASDSISNNCYLKCGRMDHSTLSMPVGIDLQAYAHDLMARYQTELHHRSIKLHGWLPNSLKDY